MQQPQSTDEKNVSKMLSKLFEQLQGEFESTLARLEEQNWIKSQVTQITTSIYQTKTFADLYKRERCMKNLGSTKTLKSIGILKKTLEARESLMSIFNGNDLFDITYF